MMNILSLPIPHKELSTRITISDTGTVYTKINGVGTEHNHVITNAKRARVHMPISVIVEITLRL